jgi:hypothetical protein
MVEPAAEMSGPGFGAVECNEQQPNDYLQVHHNKARRKWSLSKVVSPSTGTSTSGID